MHICMPRIAAVAVASCGLAVNLSSSIINQEPLTLHIFSALRIVCTVVEFISALTVISSETTNSVFNIMGSPTNKISPGACPERSRRSRNDTRVRCGIEAASKDLYCLSKPKKVGERLMDNGKREVTISAVLYGQKQRRAIKEGAKISKLFLGPVVF